MYLGELMLAGARALDKFDAMQMCLASESAERNGRV
jgi:hypothetical protein